MYEVLPRYSCGSPAMVSEAIALRVIEEEKIFHQHYLKGSYGLERQKYAELAGMEGIVILGDGRGHFVDAITGRDYSNVPYGNIRHPELLHWTQKGRQAKYFFHREELCTLPVARFLDGNMVQVLKALQEKHGMDIYSEEVAALWKTRVYFGS